MRKTLLILALIFVGSFAANMCQCPCAEDQTTDDVSFGWGDGSGKVISAPPSKNANTSTSTGTNTDKTTGTNHNTSTGTNTGKTTGTNSSTSTGTNTGKTTGTNTSTSTGTNTGKTTSTNNSTSTNTNTGKTTGTTTNTGSNSNAPNSFAKTCLDGHNQERTRLNIPNLVWDSELAKKAQTWAETIANNGELDHSPNRVHIGENTARRSYKSGVDSASLLVGQWLDEKKYFKKGNYPDISTTGSTSDVGHYSQMIWAKTTKLGCGMARGGSRDYLVCQYAESGNRKGKPVY